MSNNTRKVNQEVSLKMIVDSTTLFLTHSQFVALTCVASSRQLSKLSLGISCLAISYS